MVERVRTDLEIKMSAEAVRPCSAWISFCRE